MQDLIYPRERSLGTLTLVLGLVFWVLLLLGTVGLVLAVLLFGYLVYLFTHSTLIARIKGNGVELSPQQFPDLHQHFLACCDRLKIETLPKAYVVSGSGSLNAFATQFLGKRFVVLYSEVVDAMKSHPEGVRFYIGHELAHLNRHLGFGQLLRWPALWLPLVGAAYSRAKESTCDRHGAACCDSPESGARALVALAAGPDRWKDVNLASFQAQAGQSSGFWMSFHELTGAYPWLTKRVSRVMQPEARLPARHALAKLLALFVPYAGRLGGGFGVLMIVYLVGLLAAIALPAYQDYKARAVLTASMDASQSARERLARYYEEKQEPPESLQDAGVADTLPDGSMLSLEADKMQLTVTTAQGALVFTPSLDEDQTLRWNCSGAEGTRRDRLPPACR